VVSVTGMAFPSLKVVIHSALRATIANSKTKSRIGAGS
jgi:hypothetical protein